LELHSVTEYNSLLFQTSEEFMKFSISREQHFFFEKNHYIEFDGILRPQDQKILCDIGKKSQSKFRDLSHSDSAVKAITHNISLASIAAELTHIRPLRFGFDDVLKPPFYLTNLHNDLCIQGLACALFLCIEDEESHGIFALPAMDLASLPLDVEKKYFIIAWTEDIAQYRLHEQDKYTHELKKRGYVFGARLKEPWHPIVVR
jgi:hypothetical protein